MARWLFCTASLAWGGAERHAITLMNRLTERGHACQAVYIKNEAAQLASLRLGPAGAATCLGATRYLQAPAVRAYAATLRRFAPTVIVATNPYALMHSWLARGLARLRVPLVVTFHSNRMLDLKEAAQMLVYRPLFWMADCTVFVSARQRHYWHRNGVGSRRNLVIHNGVDTGAFRPAADPAARAALRQSLGLGAADHVIGLTAALRPEKNPTQLVEAVARLRQQGIPAQALLIGDGEMREAVEAQARWLGVAQQVRITGFQSDVRPWVQASDTMVLCSRTEALSLAAIEAMALGRPLVLSDVGGAPELVVPGDNGFLFPVGDTDALVHRLTALQDRDLARRMGEAGRSRAETLFSETAMVGRYERLLEEVVHAR